jgi:hypothetical protein
VIKAAVVEAARAAGKAGVSLGVHLENARAGRLSRRHGFVAEGEALMALRIAKFTVSGSSKSRPAARGGARATERFGEHNLELLAWGSVKNSAPRFRGHRRASQQME